MLRATALRPSAIVPGVLGNSARSRPLIQGNAFAPTPTVCICWHHNRDLGYMKDLLQLVEARNVAAPAPIEQRWTSGSSARMSPAAGGAGGGRFKHMRWICSALMSGPTSHTVLCQSYLACPPKFSSLKDVLNTIHLAVHHLQHRGAGLAAQLGGHHHVPPRLPRAAAGGDRQASRASRCFLGLVLQMQLSSLDSL